MMGTGIGNMDCGLGANWEHGLLGGSMMGTWIVIVEHNGNHREHGRDHDGNRKWEHGLWGGSMVGTWVVWWEP